MDHLNFPLLIQAVINENESIEHNRTKRQLRSLSSPLDLPEGIFRKIYRCNRTTARYLINEISPFLREVETERSIPDSLMILCTLHFYAQGSYQKGAGQDMNCPMSQSSVSRCIDAVTNVLIDHFAGEVRFPLNEEEKDEEKAKFYNLMNGFPGIIGVIDGTHIRIQAPPTEDENFPGILFYNRKGFYSLNVQIICGADLKIMALNPRYPGSVHDAAIWTTSLIRNHLVENYNEGDRSSWLLGDSGYPMEPWLLVPIQEAHLNEQQMNFNRELKRIRNIVEWVIGILKSRFRCCFSHRALHYSPLKAAKIVSACAILHNIFIARQDVMDEIEENVEVDDPDIIGVAPNLHNPGWLALGREIRNRIVEEYF